MKCLTDEEIANAAIGGDEVLTRAHLALCEICTRRMTDLVGWIDRLESAVVETDVPHTMGRARLLAALEHENKPLSLFWRIAMNRRNWVVTAAAALIGLGVFLGWPDGRHSAVLAEALRPFKDAKSFACDMINLRDGKPWDAGEPAEKRGKLKSRVTWAAPGSLVIDTMFDGKSQSKLILPSTGAGVLIDIVEKEYTPIERKSEGEDEAILQMINALAGYTSEEEKPAAVDQIDGVEAPRFDLVVADAEKRDWHYRIWANPTTKRALRVEFALIPGKQVTAKETPAIRLERFEWDVKTEGLFDAKPPADYKLNAAVKEGEVAEMTTKKIVAAMKAYRDATGRYPRTEPFELAGVTKDFEAAAKKKLDAETLKGFVLLAVLQSLSKEAVYRGKSVGPEDASKILFRWKLNDGRYRVIFGDLKADTASPEKLKEMELK